MNLWKHCVLYSFLLLDPAKTCYILDALVNIINDVFVKNSARPTPPLITRFLVNANTRSIVVKVATILQEIAFAILLTCVSISKYLFLEIMHACTCR